MGLVPLSKPASELPAPLATRENTKSSLQPRAAPPSCWLVLYTASKNPRRKSRCCRVAQRVCRGSLNGLRRPGSRFSPIAPASPHLLGNRHSCYLSSALGSDPVLETNRTDAPLNSRSTEFCPQPWHVAIHASQLRGALRWTPSSAGAPSGHPPSPKAQSPPGPSHTRAGFLPAPSDPGGEGPAGQAGLGRGSFPQRSPAQPQSPPLPPHPWAAGKAGAGSLQTFEELSAVPGCFVSPMRYLACFVEELPYGTGQIPSQPRESWEKSPQ